MTVDRARVSRRGFLTASAASVGAASVAGLAVGSAGARTEAASAGVLSVHDALLQGFQSHRLVGFGEAHGLQEHHDALQRLIFDSRIAGVIDDIVIEFGNALYQDTLD